MPALPRIALDRGHVRILATCAAVAVGIALYGVYRCRQGDQFEDPLQKNLGPDALSNWTDGWSLSHFLFYMGLAYSFPQPRYLWFIFAVGCAWEVLEASVPEKPFYLDWFGGCSAKDMIATDPKTGEAKRWWYGKWEDVVVNSAGMFIGAWLAKKKTRYASALASPYTNYASAPASPYTKYIPVLALLGSALLGIALLAYGKKKSTKPESKVLDRSSSIALFDRKKDEEGVKLWYAVDTKRKPVSIDGVHGTDEWKTKMERDTSWPRRYFLARKDAVAYAKEQGGDKGVVSGGGSWIFDESAPPQPAGVTDVMPV